MQLPTLHRPREWVRALGDRLLAAILRGSVEETAADLTQATLAAKRRTVETALEAIDFANSVDAGGDDAKKELLAAFKEDVAHIASIGRQVLSDTMSPEAGREALAAAPFESNGSVTPLPNGHQATALPKPATVPNENEPKNGQPQPLKRPRGRPRKTPPPPTA